MATVSTIHPLGPPRTQAPHGLKAHRGSGTLALPGGATLHLDHWQPSSLHLPAGVDVLTAFAEAENASGCWLEYDGRWMPTPDGGRRRTLKLSKQQPDVRLTFMPDVGPSRSWLLLVDEGGGAPGELVTWTHKEWDSENHQSGGKWVMTDGVWLRGGKSTPDGASGVLTTESLTPSAGDA